MDLLTLFAKKELTINPIDIHNGFSNRHDTVFYRDAECTKFFARWPWHYTNCPRRGQKRVVLGCCWWKLAWCN